MRYAVCNELFGSRPLAEQARIALAEGYAGLELAPYTVFGDFSEAAFRSGVRAFREARLDTGIAFVGFHWLLVGPKGLHATSPDESARRPAWDHLRRLLDAAGELGGGVLVLGSPKQRSSSGGATREEATRVLAEELARIAPFAAARDSSILLEALSSDQTDVVNTLAEARALVEGIGSPGVGGMFDFHNCGDESLTWPELIRAHRALIAHVHANEPDGSHPRAGGADFAPAFDALRESGYGGWVSMEIFTAPADPAATLRESMALFRALDREPAPARGGRISQEEGDRS